MCVKSKCGSIIRNKREREREREKEREREREMQKGVFRLFLCKIIFVKAELSSLVTREGNSAFTNITFWKTPYHGHWPGRRKS